MISIRLRVMKQVIRNITTQHLSPNLNNFKCSENWSEVDDWRFPLDEDEDEDKESYDILHCMLKSFGLLFLIAEKTSRIQRNTLCFDLGWG